MVEYSEDFIPEFALEESKDIRDDTDKPATGEETLELNREEVKDRVAELAGAQDVIADDYSQDGFEASMGV